MNPNIISFYKLLIENYEFKCFIRVDPNYPNAQEIINRSRILAIFKIY